MKRHLLFGLAAAVALPLLAPPSLVQAGGFYLTDRGTRPLGRGGAVVAGLDDAGALFYNPALLAWTGHDFMFDLNWTYLDASFTRTDSSGTALDPVSNTPGLIPNPGVAYTNNFGLERFGFGAGFFVPGAVLMNWPSEGAGDLPAPQRYSLVSMEGTAFGNIMMGAAWKPIDELSIGATFQLMIGQLAVESALSSCDQVVCSQPEDPEFDGMVQMKQFIAAPTASFGLAYRGTMIRAGASFNLSTLAKGPATLNVRLPGASLFDGAHVEGKDATVSQTFPYTLRAGLEVLPIEDLVIATEFSYESWSQQESIKIEPDNIWIRDAQLIGDYQIGTLAIPRNMKDTFGAHLGAEYTFGPEQNIQARLGASYETSAFDNAYLSPLTLDSEKVTLSGGGSYEFSNGLALDLVVSHTFMKNKTVTNSKVPQPNPIRPPTGDPAAQVYVGDGEYEMDATTVGLGMRWRLDRL